MDKDRHEFTMNECHHGVNVLKQVDRRSFGKRMGSRILGFLEDPKQRVPGFGYLEENETRYRS